MHPYHYHHEANLIVGGLEICRYLHNVNYADLTILIEQYDFPAIRRPDGKLVTSMQAIDEWIWLAACASLGKAQRWGANRGRVKLEERIRKAKADWSTI